MFPLHSGKNTQVTQYKLKIKNIRTKNNMYSQYMLFLLKEWLFFARRKRFFSTLKAGLAKLAFKVERIIAAEDSSSWL